jgi:hypothetical protein
MVLLPWFDLLTDHSLGREEEGRREVIPEGVPDEIKVLEIVPRCVPMSTDAIRPLRHRMIEDMSARKLNPHTQRSHISSCKRFAAYLKRSPDMANRREASVTVCVRHGDAAGGVQCCE